MSDGYWSGTEYAPNPIDACLFYTNARYQGFSSKSPRLYAVPVRPADVAAALPEPQTLALVTLASGALVVAVRRRPR